MKNYNLSAFLIAVLTFASVGMLQAQYDDLYYDPDTDASYSSYDYDDYAEDDYAEDTYSDYDNDPYDYYYSSRIRRFHRPYYGFNYFDPVYVDMAYYDPFIRPSGVTVLIYDDYYGRNSWNSWRRYNSYNSWNRYSAWNSWAYPYSSYNRWNRWNSWGSPYAYSGYGYGGYGLGANRWGGVGYGGFNNYYSNYYCPPSWGGGNAYNTAYSGSAGGTTQPTYSGPRRSGTVTTPNVSSRNLGNQSLNTPRGSQNDRETASPISRNNSRVLEGRSRDTNTGTLERHTIRSGRNLGNSDNRTRTTVTPNRSIERRSTDDSRTRSTTRPSINSRNRSISPSRSYNNRSTTPSRSYNTTPNRSYSPSRSSTPSRTYNSSPDRSYTPSRSISPSRSSGSSINRSSSSPSRSSSGSSGRTRSGGNE